MNRHEQIGTHPIFIQCVDEIEKYEVNRQYCRHNVAHFQDVLRIMLAENIKLNLGYSEELIYGAALLHDLGKSVQYREAIDHTVAGQDIAKVILEDCSYEQEDIIVITKAIGEHSGFAKRDGLSELLRRSDKLSRRCYECIASEKCKWPVHERNKRSYE